MLLGVRPYPHKRRIPSSLRLRLRLRSTRARARWQTLRVPDLLWISNIVIAATGVIGMFLVVRGGKDTHNLSTAAQNTATALKATQEVTSSDLRAWVDIHDATAKLEKDTLTVTVPIKNVGKSPALAVYANMALFLSDQNDPKPPQPFEYDPQPWNERTLFPNGQTSIEYYYIYRPHSSAVNKFKQFKGGTRTIWVFAKANYQDIFGRPHWTHYCAKFTQGSLVGYTCDFYNDSDPAPPNDLAVQKSAPQ
jgi:hypothetical protein